jgi:hypothetical protein
MEHRMGFEPMNTGFADQRVNHFAIGALRRHATKALWAACSTRVRLPLLELCLNLFRLCDCAQVGFDGLVPREDLVRIFVGDCARDDDVTALLPVCRGRHLVLRCELD